MVPNDRLPAWVCINQHQEGATINIIKQSGTVNPSETYPVSFITFLQLLVSIPLENFGVNFVAGRAKFSLRHLSYVEIAISSVNSHPSFIIYSHAVAT